jgi:YhcH/YjgK/YiaL family protein
MILDTLPLWHRYAALHSGFARAFAFHEGVTPATADGRHDIDGDAIYALVQRYQTRATAGMQLEAHRRYIDVQFIALGREVIHWAPLATLSEVTLPYDPTKDAGFFAPTAGTVPVRIAAGQFAILFPNDAHGPCCAWDGPEDVLKVVVKVAV